MSRAERPRGRVWVLRGAWDVPTVWLYSETNGESGHLGPLDKWTTRTDGDGRYRTVPEMGDWMFSYLVQCHLGVLHNVWGKVNI